ncbi:MAG: DNA repair protein RecO [Acholeplasma sp.]|nr:DNA repair protein RecO [Acholeplasma sp.]
MNRLEGLIFKVQPYQENSKLLQVLTPRGKISIVAKGSQKLNSNDRFLSQYLTRIEFDDTKDKTFITLKNAKLIDAYEEIKQDLKKMRFAGLVLEIISKIYIDENSEKVYDLAISALKFNIIAVSSLNFAIKVLYYLGYGPSLIGDGNKVKGFNISKGSIVYETEDLTLDLNYQETIILLKLAYQKIDELEDIENKDVEVIKDFIYKYYLDKIDLRIKILET